MYPSIEFRVVNGVVEFRVLILREQTDYDENGSGNTVVYIDDQKPYTDWAPFADASRLCFK